MAGQRRRGKFSDFVIVGAALYAAAVLTYAWLRRSFLPAAGLAAFAVLPAVFLVLCAAMLRRSPAARARFALAVAVTGAGLYALEAFLLLSSGERLLSRARASAAAREGVRFDTRPKREVVADLRAAGVEAYPTFHPSLIVELNGLEPKTGGPLFPLAGVSRKTTVFDNESGTYTVYMSDEKGFNNPTGLWESGSVDVALIGDSYVQGFAVARHETLAGRLREAGVRAISLGIGGSGPLIELATLREYAAFLQPPVVLWFYHELTDIPDLVSESGSPFLLQYLQPGFSQNLVSRQQEIDRRLIAHIGAAEKRRFAAGVKEFIKLYHLRLRLGFGGLMGTPPLTAPPPLFGVVMRSAREAVSGWDGVLYAVYLPDWTRYARETGAGNYAFRREVLDALQDAGVPVLDMHEAVFARHPDPLSLFPFRLFGHYSAEGYALVAEELARRLRQDGVAGTPADSAGGKADGS